MQEQKHNSPLCNGPRSERCTSLQHALVSHSLTTILFRLEKNGGWAT